jgi:uncharacterized protein
MAAQAHRESGRHGDRSLALKALLIPLALFAGLEIRDGLALIHLRIPGFPFPYGGAILDNLLAVLIAVGIAWVFRSKALAEDLGLRSAGWQAPALTLLACVPCYVGLALQGKFATDLSFSVWILLGILFPLAEEILFRGLGFVFAARCSRWPVPLAIAVQALAFGFVHWVGAGAGGSLALEIFAITFTGGIVLACLDLLDGYSIWCGWVLHSALNTAWMVFAVSDNATTGWLGNVLRLSAAVLALGMVGGLRLWRRRSPVHLPVP